MEQKPPVPPQRKAQSPGKRQKVEVARTARIIANENRTLEAVAERWHLKSRQEPPSPEERERMKKGEGIPLRRVPFSEEERRHVAKKYLTDLNGHSPSKAVYAAGASYYGLSEADQQEHDRAITEALEGLVNKEPEPFFAALGQWGPRLLLNPQVNAEVESWWLNLAGFNAAAAEQKQAKQYLKKIGTVLSTIVSGRHKIAEAEREAIVASCKKWYPICEELNKAFKALRQLPEYTTSARFKKEAQGTLAEKFKIDAADVKIIETHLQAPFRQAKKSPPSSVMLRIVARKHFPQGDTSRHTQDIIGFKQG